MTEMITSPHSLPFAHYLALGFECPRMIRVSVDAAESLVYAAYDMPDSDELPDWSLAECQPLPISPDVLHNAVIVCDAVIAQQPEMLLAQIKTWLDTAQCVLLTTPDRDRVQNSDSAQGWNRDEFESLLRDHDLRIEHLGHTADTSCAKNMLLAVLANNHLPLIEPAPPDFRVAAIITVYNESDVLLPVIDHLNSQGVGVYIIDNWSTDGTYGQVRERLDQGAAIGVIGLERFPAEKPANHTFDLRQILIREDEVARALDADWVMHHDADEIREAPWPGVTLRDAIYFLDRCGYNSVNHTMIDFFPSGDDFQPGDNPTGKIPYFEFGKYPGYFVRVNAWQNFGESLPSLWGSGGHHVVFAGQRVYPYKFLLRHYPFRSRVQTVRKIRARQKGSSWLERTLFGWHHMYDRFGGVDDDQLFEEVCITSRTARIHFDPGTFYDHYLVERISGVGLERLPPRNWTRHVPKFALPFFRLGKRLLDRVLG
ncbi:MAG: glycosyltransferase family 2 protein [Anaerolineae bacterium]|nr:glycosyltransferase family 2 protein [Anaerolineae bacterium]